MSGFASPTSGCQISIFCYGHLGHGHKECLHWTTLKEKCEKEGMLYGNWLRAGYVGGGGFESSKLCPPSARGCGTANHEEEKMPPGIVEVQHWKFAQRVTLSSLDMTFLKVVNGVENLHGNGKCLGKEIDKGKSIMELSQETKKVMEVGQASMVVVVEAKGLTPCDARLSGALMGQLSIGLKPSELGQKTWPPKLHGPGKPRVAHARVSPLT